MKKHKLFLLFIASCFLLLSNISSAAMLDPKANWQTIKSDHFFIRYPKVLEPIAQDSARIFEEVHEKLVPKAQWKPWGRTEVILTDSVDESNGLTLTIPYNWIILYVVPPRPDSTLANYDDWLRTLIIHEYSHALHVDAARLAWKPLRFLLGKTVAPAGLTPGWVREGLSVYEESVETTAGRNRASFTEMLIRTSMLEDNFPAIDEAGGLMWKWPSYTSAYLYGGKFVEYLVNTYGEDKFIAFNKRVQSSVLLSMVNHHARNVYGKTFYEIWREWRGTLKEKYDGQKSNLEKEGLTNIETVVSPKWDDQFFNPTLSPDGKKLVYVSSSPHKSAEIKIKNLETGKETKIVKQSASQFSWSPDGQKIVFASEGQYKRYNFYFDLRLYDVEKKQLIPLTSGARARDPDFDPQGKEIVYIEGREGTDTIKLMNLETREITNVTTGEPRYAHFANPRFSPDGKSVAVVEKTKEEGWKIKILSLDGSSSRRLTSGSGMETSPWWSKDGNYIFYTSDETGIPNIYRASVESGVSTKLSNVLTAVFEPTTEDGETVFVREYHSKGFVISSFKAPAIVEEARGKKHEARKSKKQEAGSLKSEAGEGQSEGDFGQTTLDYPTQKYSPFGKSLFMPRYVLPNIAYIEDAVFLSATTGGSDALKWHNWMLGGTFRTDAKDFGYYGRYWYNRWRPVFGLGINDYTVNFGNLFKRGNELIEYFEERRNLSAFASLPINNHNFSLNYFYEDRMPETKLTEPEKDAINLGIFSGFSGGYVYSDVEKYPASISPENGRTIRLTGVITDSVFGSAEKNEQVIFAGDWREYIRLWHHQVMALRATGGMTWGDKMAQGTFGLGGAIGEGSLAGGGSYNYFPLRGLPFVTLSRTRAMLLSGEYRLPIVSPQRGIGTWPFFLKEMHLALFADYGDAWYSSEKTGGFVDFFDDFMLGVGTELRGDFILGHGLPVTGRLGYGIIVVNRDRIIGLEDPLLKSDLKYGTLILQVGTSF